MMGGGGVAIRTDLCVGSPTWSESGMHGDHYYIGVCKILCFLLFLFHLFVLCNKGQNTIGPKGNITSMYIVYGLLAIASKVSRN